MQNILSIEINIVYIYSIFTQSTVSDDSIKAELCGNLHFVRFGAPQGFWV